MIRILPALVLLVLAIAVTWFLARRSVAPVPQAPAPTVPAAPTPVPADTPTAAGPADPAYRLAGTVVGDRRYAIIEAPDGRNDLYGIDAEVPDIGRLIAVGPNWATFESDGERFDMRVLPGPTPTARAAAARGAAARDDGADMDDYGADDDLDYSDDEYDDVGDGE